MLLAVFVLFSLVSVDVGELCLCSLIFGFGAPILIVANLGGRLVLPFRSARMLGCLRDA